MKKLLLSTIFSIGAVLAILYSSPLIKATEIVPIEKKAIVVDFSSFDISDDLKKSITSTLQNKPIYVLEGLSYKIISARVVGNEGVFSIAVLDGPSAKTEYIGAGLSGALVLAIKSEKEEWRSAIEGTQDYLDMVEVLSNAFVPRESKDELKGAWEIRHYDNLSPLSSLTPKVKAAVHTGFSFPWESSTTFSYTQGFYGISHNGDGAVDFAPTGGNHKVLAAAAGTVTVICTIGTETVNLRISHSGTNLEYWHIKKASLPSNIYSTATVSKGQFLGTTTDGGFGDSCGYGDGAHLHWILPTDDTFIADGWQVTFSNSTWSQASNQSNTRSIGAVFSSSNTINYGVSTACGIDNVFLTGMFGAGLDILTCRGNNALSIQNSNVSNLDIVTLNSGGTVSLEPGFSATSFQAGGQFRAVIN